MVLRVLLLSRYCASGASSRVRYLQYFPYFQSQDIDVTVSSLLSDTYLRALYSGGSRWREVASGYLGRLRVLLLARRFDAVILEKELFPFLPATAERLLRASGIPYLVDYDDAWFHRYDLHPNLLVRRLLGRKIDAVMRHSSIVVVGNEYLAERAKHAGAPRVEIVPTVVNAERYRPRQVKSDTVPVIGWIGTPQTSRYLLPLLPVFRRLKERVPLRVVAVGARPDDFEGSIVEVQPWSEETEVERIQMFDIGIMPLSDTPWERGKCGYKLIQYMACGIPVIASPVGVNEKIVKHGINGFLASDDGWEEHLMTLLQNPKLRQTLGAQGRRDIEAWYSLQVQAPRWVSIIREVAGGQT
jgi:glycosyltransferase involved in cell wall biosynthesis